MIEKMLTAAEGRQILRVCSLLFLTLTVACGDKRFDNPEDALVRYLAQEFLAGDAIIGQRELIRDSVNAVFETTAKKGETIAQQYTFLSNSEEDGWTVNASRSLDLEDSVLQRISDLNPANDGHTGSSGLATHLHNHITAFDSLAQLYSIRPALTPIDANEAVADEVRDGRNLGNSRNEKIAALLKEVSAQGVFHDSRYPNCIFIKMAGNQRSEIGYIWKKEECSDPEMNPQDFIHVEEIAEGWLTYKYLWSRGDLSSAE